MNFNELIIEKLHPLFIRYGLIIEQTENIVKYQFKQLIICLVHNSRENSNTLWVGEMFSSSFVEIDDYIISNFFNSDLKINNLPLDTFVDNLHIFFTSIGKSILNGDKQIMMDLEKFDNIRSKKYTLQLLDEQNIELANKSWNEGNYRDVVKYLKKVDDDNLSWSSKKKFRIALQRLND